VSTDGAFRRSIGDVWLDAHTALPNGATGAQVSVGMDGTIWALDAEGALYLQQSSQPGPSPSGGAAVDLAAGQNGTGQPYLFSIDASGNAFSTTKPPGSGKWNYWDEIAGPGSLTLLCFGQDQDGTPEVFGLSNSGLAYHSWPADDGWNSFQLLGNSGQPNDNLVDFLASGKDASGLLWVFAIAGDDANIAAIYQQPGSSTGWSDWTWLPTSPAAPFVALATGNDPGGAMEVFAIDLNGGVHHIWQMAGGWSQWAPLGPPLVPAQTTLGSLAACNQPNGPIYVFALGSDANIYVINGQPSGAEGWSNWGSLGSVEGVQPLALAAAAGPGKALRCCCRAAMERSIARLCRRVKTQPGALACPQAPLARKASGCRTRSLRAMKKAGCIFSQPVRSASGRPGRKRVRRPGGPTGAN
jgi:hypothetical protein